MPPHPNPKVEAAYCLAQIVDVVENQRERYTFGTASCTTFLVIITSHHITSHHMLSRVEGAWGKLHPSMYNSLIGSQGYKLHDADTQGCHMSELQWE